jgi:hypothetical protein
MDDARRYRLNAAEWHALARHDEAMRDLLASWGWAAPAAEPSTNARDQDRKGSTLRPRSRLWVVVSNHVLLVGERHKPSVRACGLIDE